MIVVPDGSTNQKALLRTLLMSWTVAKLSGSSMIVVPDGSTNQAAYIAGYPVC